MRLHAEIFPKRGARTRIADLGDAFPENDVHTTLIALDDLSTRKIDQIYAEMEEELAALDGKIKEDGDALPITIRLRARQKIELLKVPGLCDLARDTVEEGRTHILFLNFNESVDAALELLKDLKPAVIRGGQTAEEREAEVQRVQTNATRSAVVNVAAGGLGVGFHALAGNFPRSSDICPNDDARMVIQAFGRIHRAGGKSKCQQRIVGVAGTVEVQVLENYLDKLGRIQTLNDGQ